jgi:hypothetical protein
MNIIGINTKRGVTMAYKFDQKKYEEIAKRMFGGFTPYNPPDSSYYRDLGYRVYKRREEEKKRKKRKNEEKKIKELINKYGIKENKHKEESGILDKIKSILGDLGDSDSKKQHSFLDDVVTPAKQWAKGVVYTLNPFDGKDFTDAFKEAVDIAKKTDRSGITKELNRAGARIANTATLGALDELYKKTRGERASQFKERKGGGRVADFLYDLLGYGVSGAGVAKGLRGLGLGAKEGTKGLSKIAQLAKEGALTGLGISSAEVGIKEALNPKDQDWKENLAKIGIETAGGAILDPAAHGVLKLISRFRNAKNEPINVLNNPKDYFKIKDYKYDGPIIRGTAEGQTVIENPAKALRLPAPEEPGYKNPFTGRKDPLQISGVTSRPKLETKPLELPEPIYKFKEPINKEVKIEGIPALEAPVGGGKPKEYWQQRLKELNDYVSNNEILKEFKQAVEDQYQYLKQSLKNRKGVQKGVIKDREGYVQGAYGFSENPKWYQDFYRQFGRTPTNEDLRQLAREQVLNGFADEVGEIPAWQPSALENIDNQIDELTTIAKESPEHSQAVKPLIDALEQEKQAIIKQYEQLKNAKNDDDVIRRIWDALKGDDDVTLEDLKKLANPPDDTNVPPLIFKREKYFRKEPLRYVGRLNPEDMKREKFQTEGFTTTPTNDGVRINPKQPVEEEPLRFKIQEEPLRFKKTIIRTNHDDGYTPFEEVKPQETPKTEKEQIQERIDEIKQYMKTVKDKEQKEMYQKQIRALENELKKAEEKELLDADVTFDELLKNADRWKDKSKFLLKRETMDRNFEDIMGEDAPMMKKIFLDPIKKSEAERIRFLNEERKRVKTYGIKPGSKDDELVQMYGEKKITLDELKKRTPNWKRVKEAAESYRKTYDRLLDTVNQVLTENGFDPIPKRKDYFPHFEEVDGILKQLGFDLENHTLPTDINGLTADFKPNKSFFRHALQRKSDQTDYGAAIGFDRYIEGISNVIFHTKNIKRLRALDKEIREKYKGDTHLSNFAAELTEYANILAGKKAMIDRAFEDVVGRKIYNFFDTVRRRVSANMIGANIGSALTSYIPLTQALATTNKRAFVQGMFETILNTFKNDGFINESDFLTKRIGSDPLYRTLWDKAAEKSMWLMKTIDTFTAQTIVRGKYNELISKGVPHEQAIKQADEWAARIMADRSKGSMPTLFNSKSLGALTQFQLEVNNQLSFLFKDMPRNMDKKGLASAMAQVLIYSYIFNNLYEKVTGRRPAFDPIGVALQAYKDYNNDNITNLKATDNLRKNIQDMLPFVSFISGGRYPIEAGIPDINALFEGKTDWKTESLKPLIYLLPPAGGGQLKKAYEGLTVMGENPLSPQPMPGVYRTNKNGERVLSYPVEDNDANFWRALLFGKSALPETKEFYNNNRRDLSPKQTKLVEKYPDPKAAYEAIMAARREHTILDKIKKIDKSKEMSNEEKAQRIENLIEQLKRLREGK